MDVELAGLLDDGCSHVEGPRTALRRNLVLGRYRCFHYGAFWYDYTCEECGRCYSEQAPELTPPALCHFCFTGKFHAAERHKAHQRRRERKKKG